MPRVLLGLCSLVFVGVASRGAAQSTRAVGEVLARMRADLDARHYATAIERGNALLESPNGPAPEERMQLWQLLASAYFPPDRGAQHADSASLVLAAMVRLVPDVMLERARSWGGLDSLLEVARAAQFSVVTRPRREYLIAHGEPAAVVVVASRPARFRLTSIALATGEAVTHAVVEGERFAALPLSASGSWGESFTSGPYRLEVWATDRETGDSVLLVHRATATLLPPERAPAMQAPVSSGEAPVVAADVAPPRARTGTDARTSTRTVRTPATRMSVIVNGFAFAGATVALAALGRTDGALRSVFTTDPRAYIVSAAMVGATLAALRGPSGRVAATRATARRDPPPAAPLAVRVVTRVAAPTPRILLRLDPTVP